MIYGLFARPAALDAYYSALDEVRVRDLSVLSETTEPHHIFTDGSCTQPAPSRKSERRATFAVRHAQKNSHQGELLAAGILPGRKQTAFRAELWAFMIAMTASANSVIYTDCEGVYKGIVKMQKSGWCELAWLSSPDVDLWRGAWSILNFPGRRLQIEWTRAHRSMSAATNALESWKIYHNHQVDRSASFEANPLPPHIQPLWDQLKNQNDELETLRKEVVLYLKNIWASHATAEQLTSDGNAGHESNEGNIRQ